MTTITKERLEWLSNISGRDDIDDIDGVEIRELARIALASLEAVPVYQVVYDSDTWRDINQTQFADHVNHGSPVRIVYTAPPASVSVPDALPENDDEEGNDIDYMEPSEVYALGRAAGWNACRAAMLRVPNL